MGKFWTHNIFLKNQQKLLLTGVELVTTATSPPGMYNNEVMCKQSTNSDRPPNNEQEKRRAYDQRVREIEHGSFTPLVFSASSGMGPTARVFYKKLASMIVTKHNKAYNKTLNWMSCRISFSLLRSAVMCLRGSHSSRGRPALPTVGEGDTELALIEGRVGQ